MKLNKVEIASGSLTSAGSSSAKKSYILVNSDKFWKQQKGSTFPVVAESIAEELEKYKQYETQLKSLKNTIVNWSFMLKNIMNKR